MLSQTMTTSQMFKVTVPQNGKDRRGRNAPLEGPALFEIDSGSEAFVSVELDPADATQSTLIVRSRVDENTSGEPPFMATGRIGRDAHVGTEHFPIWVPFAVEITAGQAASMVLTAGTPEEQPQSPTP